MSLDAQEIDAYKLKLRAVGIDDLEQLRQWRNSPEIRNNMLSQNVISVEQQKQWFKTLSAKVPPFSNLQKKKVEFHFLVEYKNRPVGYANYKMAKGFENGQTSLYIGEKKYRGTILAYCLALALLDFIFIELEEIEINAVVLEHNKAAIRYNKKLGYQITTTEQGLVKMHLKKEHYLQARKELKKIIRV